jgi:hypothetical protein
MSFVVKPSNTSADRPPAPGGSGAPNRGPCAKCGESVYHAFPWWNGNPNKPGSRPYHDECWHAKEAGLFPDVPPRHAAQVRICPRLLFSAIPFPAGTTLRGAELCNATGELILVLEHPDLPAVKHGDAIPFASPMFSRREPVVFDGWGL